MKQLIRSTLDFKDKMKDCLSKIDTWIDTMRMNIVEQIRVVWIELGEFAAIHLYYNGGSKFWI